MSASVVSSISVKPFAICQLMKFFGMFFCFITKEFISASSSNGAPSFTHLLIVRTATQYSFAICAIVRFSRLPLALASSSLNVRCSDAVKDFPALTLDKMFAMFRFRIASNGILSAIKMIHQRSCQFQHE